MLRQGVHSKGHSRTILWILGLSALSCIRADDHPVMVRQGAAPILPAPVGDTATTSTTFDYWWPYPPATAAFPTTSVATLLAETNLVTGSTVLSTSESSSTSSETTTGTDDSSSSFQSTSDGTSSTDDSSVTQSVSNATVSIITITALPPSSTPSPVPPSPYHEVSNPLRFTPIFAVIGGVLGVIVGWLLYELWKRRLRKISQSDIAGACYSDLANNDGDAGGANSQCQERRTQEEINDDEREQLFSGANAVDRRINTSHQRETAQILNSGEVRKNQPRWLSTNFLTLLQSPSPTRESTPRDESDQIHSPSRLLNSDMRTHTDFRSPLAPTIFSSVASSDEDEDYADARRNMKQGTVRQKSLRKKVTESIRSHFSSRSKSRTKSRGQTPEMEEGVLLSGDFEVINGSPSTYASMRRKKTDSHHSRTTSDFTLPANGLATPSKSYFGDTLTRGLKRYTLRDEPAYANSPTQEDKYSPMPSRKTRSLKTRSFVDDPKTEDETNILLASSPQVDPDVLPASPPRLSSPKFDSDLMFSPSNTSILQTPPRTMLPTTRYFGNASDSDELTMTPRKGPSGPRQPRKLISKRSPSRNKEGNRDKALPATPPHRRAIRSSSNSPTKQGTRGESSRRARSNTDPSRGSTSAKERYEARHSALDKVDTIVSQSWSTRNLRGIPAPLSQTMFGAQVDNQVGPSLEGIKEESGPMQSIEQALGSLQTRV